MGEEKGSVAGIVAEFNPFHNGHAALVDAVRKAGAAYVVTVMSGNFVQRGGAAIAEKHVRAKAALRCGVDLVLELPLPYAAAPAPRFAQGAVRLLQATGCVETLAFGSECGNADQLLALARVVEDPALKPALRRFLEEGVTFARARELAVEEHCGTALSHLLATPNNALGVEYLRQAAAIGWKPEFFTIRRIGAEHDGIAPAGAFASASYLRSGAGEWEAMESYVPTAAVEVYRQARRDGLFPASPGKLDVAVLATLRGLSPRQLEQLPDLSEGLENRLYGAVRKAGSLQELEQLVKTKRYTLARVRRLILAAFLGITRQDCSGPPPYLRVLGFNHRGREVLARIKGNQPDLPVQTSLARLRELGGACQRAAFLEERATDLYALCLPAPLPCGYEYSASAVYLKE